MFYRSSMHTSSPFTTDGRLNKSSLEVYSSLGANMENQAMSTVELKLNEGESSAIGNIEQGKSIFRAVSTVPGEITVFSSEPTKVNIVNVMGQTEVSQTVRGEVKFTGISKGIYIVNNKKIIVR